MGSDGCCGLPPSGGGGGAGSNYATPAASHITGQQGLNSGDGQVIIAWPDFAAVGEPVSLTEQAAHNFSEYFCARCHGELINLGEAGGVVHRSGLAGVACLAVSKRSYSSLMASILGRFGYGWTDSSAMSLSLGSGSPPSQVTLNQETGLQLTFTWSGGVYNGTASGVNQPGAQHQRHLHVTRQARIGFSFDAAGNLPARTRKSLPAQTINSSGP